MKQFFFFSFFFLLCYNNAEAQTYANIPGPENVLVVYNSNSSISDSVKEYYQTARGIPAVNVVRLDSLVRKDITINNETRAMNIAEGGNIIRDSLGHKWGSWFVTQHAWKYFYQYMAAPIKEHIVSNNLTDIKYIVLCKGVPYKIQAGGDFDIAIGNISIDGLLCMLNTENYDALLDAIYNEYRSNALPSPYYCYQCLPQIINPYYNADPNLLMNNRFKPGVFTQNWNGRTIKLDYLVSHLDGINYNMVKGMIDLSTAAIHADNYDWFIDADPTPCHGGNIMVSFANSTASKLNSIGFTNYSFNTDEDTVTYYNKPVMSYSSNGVHTTKPPNTIEGQTLHPNYIQTQLNFNYAPGAIFNTAESFNGYLLSSIGRLDGAAMGQVVEFFLKGGTLGVGHAYEPFVRGVIQNGIMLPSYQLGYSFIDAAYMGMPYLAWQNVIVGDPLTTIAWGKQTLTEDITMSSTNLITGEIEIPLGSRLTLTSNTALRFRHLGFITGDGFIETGNGYTLDIIDWSKSLFKSFSDNHPKIIWGAYPDEGNVVGYNIYRKLGTEQFELIKELDGGTFEFIDTEVFIVLPIMELPKNAQYYITAITYDEGSDESSPSNTVEYWVEKAGKLALHNKVNKYSFELNQNYPNPFNPTTQIRFSIPNAGLVTLKVYNTLGQEVAVLVDGYRNEGNHIVEFNASKLVSGIYAKGGYASGVYLYRIVSDGFSETKKMTLIR